MSTLTENPVAALAQRGMIIGDTRPTSSSIGAFAHRYPGDGQVQAEVPFAGASEVDQAVAAARAALPGWRSTSPDERGRILWRLADLLLEHTDELAEILTRETGRPIQETQADPVMTAQWVRYYAGYADKIEGHVVPTPAGTSGLDYVLAEPYGVIAVMTPYNIGLISCGMKCPAALAAGNTIVLKPSDLTPFSGLRFAELALEAGLPPGVLNVVPGGPEAGEALVRHDGVDKITFTGGTPTASKVMAAAAEGIKPICLELGGKAANMVFPDADLDAASQFALYMGSVYVAGQGCLLPTRLFVHDDIYDEMEQRLAAMQSAFATGDPLDPQTMVGPVISEGAMERIMGVIDRAKTDGSGRLVHGGERLGGDLAGGYFISPTLFSEVDNDSPLAQEEIFGPVLSMLRFSSEEDAIEKANSTQYGLSAYLFTNDLSRAHRMARDLEAGYISVNGWGGLGPAYPLSGVKQSGFGSEGGSWGIQEFLRPKNVFITL